MTKTARDVVKEMDHVGDLYEAGKISAKDMFDMMLDIRKRNMKLILSGEMDKFRREYP